MEDGNPIPADGLPFIQHFFSSAHGEPGEPFNYHHHHHHHHTHHLGDVLGDSDAELHRAYYH